MVAAAVVLRPSSSSAAAAAGAGAGGAGGAAAAAVGGELIEWCRARLAHYKVPSRVHIVEAMPVTGSGKVLKRALRDMLTGPDLRPTAAAAPPAAAADAPGGGGGAGLRGMVAAAGQLLGSSPAAGAAAGAAEGVLMGVTGVDAQELASLAAVALGTDVRVVALGGEMGSRLWAGACYVLPLVGGVAAAEQVSCEKGNSTTTTISTIITNTIVSALKTLRHMYLASRCTFHILWVVLTTPLLLSCTPPCRRMFSALPVVSNFDITSAHVALPVSDMTSR